MGNRLGYTERTYFRLLLVLLVLSLAANAETEYGSNYNKSCVTGRCTIVLGVNNVLVGGEYMPFKEAVKLNWAIDGFSATFPDFGVKVTPQIQFKDTTTKLIDADKAAELSTVKSSYIIDADTKPDYEYALLIEDIPKETTVDAVVLDIQYSGDIKPEEIVVDKTNNVIKLKGQYILDFNDLEDMGYPIELKDINTLNIGGVAGKTTLLLDPAIILYGGGVHDDAEVIKWTPDTNAGAATYMRVGSSGDYSTTYLTRSFIKFTLNGTALHNTTAVVSDVTLRLYALHDTLESSHCNTYSLYGVSSQSWLEESITWNLQPTMDTALITNQLSARCADGGLVYDEWNFYNTAAFSSFVQEIIRNTTKSNISFGIKLADESSEPLLYKTTYEQMRSKEYGSGYEYLFITYGTTTTTTATTTTTSSTVATTTSSTSTTRLLTLPASNATGNMSSYLYGVKKENFLNLSAFLFVCLIMLLFSALTAYAGLLLTAAVMWLFWAIGWMQVDALYIALISLVAVVFAVRGGRRPLG